MPKYTVPKNGTKIGYSNGKISVPDNPIIPYFPGDGTGPDLWRATQVVLDAAVEKKLQGQTQNFMDGSLRGINRIEAL